MSSDYVTILLAGREPRPAPTPPLCHVGFRRNVELASPQCGCPKYLSFVACDLAVICYTLEENEQKKAHQRSAWSS